MDTYTDPQKHVELRNGVKMPMLGLGTSHSGGYSHPAVLHALTSCGYRHVDTARRYGVEAFLGEALQESGVARAEMFLASKCWPTDYGAHTVREALDVCLGKLRTDYLDLYMLHWPVVPSQCSDPASLIRDTWRTLEVLMDEGKTRAIGVSNFTQEDLLSLVEEKEISGLPLVNQCEMHPYHSNVDIREFCKDNKILFTGYCPLGSGQLLGDPIVGEIAVRLRRTPAQVLLRWALQHGVPAIPKSTNLTRIAENIQIFDFQLSGCDMRQLDGLPQCLTVMPRGVMQERVDDCLPDGYRLAATR